MGYRVFLYVFFIAFSVENTQSYILNAPMKREGPSSKAFSNKNFFPLFKMDSPIKREGPSSKAFSNKNFFPLFKNDAAPELLKREENDSIGIKFSDIARVVTKPIKYLSWVPAPYKYQHHDR